MQAHHLKDRVGAVVIFIVAALGWWWSGGFPVEAQMFPRAILGLMGLLAVIMFAKTFAGATTADDQPFIGNARNLAITIACFVVYILLVSTIGFFTSSAIMLPALALLLGFRNPIVIVASTAGFIAIVYLVFVEIFSRPLPVEFFAQ